MKYWFGIEKYGQSKKESWGWNPWPYSLFSLWSPAMASDWSKLQQVQIMTVPCNLYKSAFWGRKSGGNAWVVDLVEEA